MTLRHNVQTESPRDSQRFVFSAVSALIVVGFFATVGNALQGVPQRPPTRTRAHVEALASPRLEGRLTGSAGEQLAGNYLMDELRKAGAKPTSRRGPATEGRLSRSSPPDRRARFPHDLKSRRSRFPITVT